MPPKKKTDVIKEKGNDLFEFLSAITTDQRIEYYDTLTDTEKKKYKNSRYMIHRFLSMNPLYAQVIDEIQKYPNVPDRNHYLFLTSILPKAKQYNKYIKGVKEEKYESWLIDIVKKEFSISKNEAIEYLEIYYLHDKNGLRELCEKYGIDNKTLKKAKL